MRLNSPANGQSLGIQKKEKRWEANVDEYILHTYVFCYVWKKNQNKKVTNPFLSFTIIRRTAQPPGSSHAVRSLSVLSRPQSLRSSSSSFFYSSVLCCNISASHCCCAFCYGIDHLSILRGSPADTGPGCRLCILSVHMHTEYIAGCVMLHNVCCPDGKCHS